MARFEVAHMYGVHDLFFHLFCYSGLPYSAPYGIPSRWRSAGATKLGLLIDLDPHKPVTVEMYP